MDVQSVDGDVELTFTARPTNDARVRTVDGDIVVRIPADLSASMEARATDGDVSVEPKLGTARMRRNRVSGDLNGGGVRLVLNSVDGDIRVRL